MNDKFLKPYDAAATEDNIYSLWEKSGYFNPDKCTEDGVCAVDAEAFSIVLPPPNVTGELHLGHAFEDSTQDATIRFQRMLGKKTLWVPGTDHAAIATQSKFEKEHFKKEKKSRHDYPRDEFFSMIQEFALGNQSTILSQLRKMGASLDWSRLCFTLDEQRQDAVFEAFKRMYDTGLIYQKHRVVNWDPKGQTTISDDEIVREDRKAKMYTFKYSSEFPFPIATTRPETKLGDTAVAVHPDDARYKEYIGKEYSFEFAGEPVTVKVIADEEVDPEFGVGALGVTPAHSVTDWEISQRHDLPIKQVINEYGKMMVGMEGVKDTKAAIARDAVAAWLRTENLMINEEEIDQSVSKAERTEGILEPLPKLQWWVDVNKKFPYPHDSLSGIKKDQEVSLKDLMLHAVDSEKVSILPERFDKVYRHWIKNLRDWNISRQIIYGHQIPVWYKDKEIKVSKTSPGDGWTQDEDTLDTWFSSGLWSFSTLGWPDTDSDDFKNFHPTSLINPGYEILQLWISRMIMFSTFLVGQVPFKTVSIHGMLRDAKGQKFSKSLNNGINPLEVIDQYGTDALRMSLIIGVSPGQDMNFDLQKVTAYSKFSNKIWNATRFVLENTEGFDMSSKPELETDHQNFITLWEEMVGTITKEMEEYKFYLVGEKLYHFFWHTFADVAIENMKSNMNDSAKYTLLYLLKEQLKALHPFMPFITEEIWQNLPGNDGKLLMIEKWPKV